MGKRQLLKHDEALSEDMTLEQSFTVKECWKGCCKKGGQQIFNFFKKRFEGVLTQFEE